MKKTKLPLATLAIIALLRIGTNASAADTGFTIEKTSGGGLTVKVNGQPFAFHYAQPVDSAGELPDGRPFRDIREFKQLLRDEDALLARNLVKQLLIYATGAPIRFSDRGAIERILSNAKSHDYGVRSLVHEIVQSDLFREK